MKKSVKAMGFAVTIAIAIAGISDRSKNSFVGPIRVKWRLKKEEIYFRNTGGLLIVLSGWVLIHFLF